ncbi:unnamed protein product [Mytilus edulis]|uniref:Uncharacterized protein n=1 Tax=Mytilus edulis TaxID=6550 RepID=A0A8S3QUR5_MYTED|nr:unnamed protein product [Mytilus edulis]
MTVVCNCGFCISNRRCPRICADIGNIEKQAVCTTRNTMSGKPNPPTDIRIDVIDNKANLSWIIPTDQDELEPPRNVTIQVIDNIAKVLWTITTNQELNTSKSLISLFTSNGTKVAIDSSNNFKYLKYPVTSYDIVNLTLCSEYVVKIEYLSRGVWSGITEQKFWMTSFVFMENQCNLLYFLLVEDFTAIVRLKPALEDEILVDLS